jgi:hypothetical protein
MSLLHKAFFSKEAVISWTIAGAGAYYLYTQQTKKTPLEEKYERYGQDLMRGEQYQTFLEEHKKKKESEKQKRGWFFGRSK